MRNLLKGCICYLFFCFIICANALAQPQKLYFNPATAGAAVQSKFIEITRFIPIDDAAVKVGTSSALYITQQYWIIYDYYDKKLIFLTKQGKFVKFVSLKKYGDASITYDNKNEVLKFNIKNKRYTLTSKDLLKIRRNYSKKSNRKYFKNYEIDLKDTLLSIKRTATNPYFIINARWFYDDYYFVSDLNSDSKTKDSIGYELEVLQNYKAVQSFFPYNKGANNIFKYAGVNSNTGISSTDTPYIKYASRLFNTTIYKLNKDSMAALYEFVLPLENTMPAKYALNGFKSKAEWDIFNSSYGAVFYSFNGIKDFNRYLFFGVKYMRNYESFLYDKADAKFYKTRIIKADSSQYNIQLLQNGLGQYHGGHYYNVVPAQGLIDFYNKNKEKNISYPPNLEVYLKTATKNSNPVIVEYKIKE